MNDQMKRIDAIAEPSCSSQTTCPPSQNCNSLIDEAKKPAALKSYGSRSKAAKSRSEGKENGEAHLHGVSGKHQA